MLKTVIIRANHVKPCLLSLLRLSFSLSPQRRAPTLKEELRPSGKSSEPQGRVPTLREELRPSGKSSDPQGRAPSLMEGLQASWKGTNPVSLCISLLPLVFFSTVLRVLINSLRETLGLRWDPHEALGCVLSPLLYTLLTYDCVATHASNSIITFTDDTTEVGLITNNDETAFREVVRALAE